MTLEMMLLGPCNLLACLRDVGWLLLLLLRSGQQQVEQ